jgi:hypothetical protein
MIFSVRGIRRADVASPPVVADVIAASHAGIGGTYAIDLTSCGPQKHPPNRVKGEADPSLAEAAGSAAVLARGDLARLPGVDVVTALRVPAVHHPDRTMRGDDAGVHAEI